MTLASLQASSIAHTVFAPGHDEYHESMQSYWSKQESELSAAGVVKPKNAQEVGVAVKILHNINTTHDFTAPFAVRGGGHQAYPGSANIQSGIVIDVRKLRTVTISEDKSLVMVGAGCSFEDVYSFLEPMGLNIPGARVAQVGVSGFTLGGGISYYSPHTGFVCDNVEQFEIVIADGSTTKATSSEHTDLFKSLKGGGNNFGIVTSVTFRTMPNEDLWGGALMNQAADFSKTTFHMHKNITSPDLDRKNAGPLSYSNLKYTKSLENPPVMQGFTEIPSLHNSMRVSSLADLTVEEGKYSLPGERRLYMTNSFVSDPRMLEATRDVWHETLQSVKDITGIEWSIVLNPIVPSAIREGEARGGNALGIKETRPVIVALLVGTWDEAADDEYCTKIGWQTMDTLCARAKELEVFHPYIYMNYAWKGQRVIDGYGAEMKTFLQGVSKKYDPDGLFQKAVPGGFKLFT